MWTAGKQTNYKAKQPAQHVGCEKCLSVAAKYSKIQRARGPEFDNSLATALRH